MGYIKHHTIIVTSWNDKDIKEVHNKSKDIFNNIFKEDYYETNEGGKIISEIIQGISNGQSSFFIAPDGSKEGWETSNKCDEARKEFLNWLKLSNYYCDYIEIMFGGDDEIEKIVRSKDKDFDEDDPYNE